MRRFLLVIIVVGMLVFAVIPQQVTHAEPNPCTYSGVASLIMGFSFPIKAGASIGFTVVSPAVGTLQVGGRFNGQAYWLDGNGTVQFTGTALSDTFFTIEAWSYTGAIPPSWTLEVSDCPVIPVTPIFTDGRLNANDAAQTAALYCDGADTLYVYVPGSPQWKLAFIVTPEELAEFPATPSENVLIKEGLGARLYRLTSGELQINSPNLDPEKSDYTYIFQGCSM
jgi:hypothetical protein